MGVRGEIRVGKEGVREERGSERGGWKERESRQSGEREWE